MQLVAYGAQDIYLTGNPQITFFKVVYRRHTNFSMECIEQTINGTNTLSTSATSGTVTISRNGDLIYKVYVTSDSEAITNGDALVSEVELEIGGQEIDKHYMEWNQLWGELSTPESKAVGFKSMKGCLGASRGDGPGLVQVPLNFWFCRNPGLALPLIALQYHEVKLKFTWGTSATTSVGAAAVCKVMCDYIYLDTDERRRFAQVSHEYLIEQLQKQPATEETSNKLTFNHPVKELIWVTPHLNAYGTARLILNGHDRFSDQQEEYFQLRQPYDYHTAIPSQNLPAAGAKIAGNTSITGFHGPTAPGVSEAADGSVSGSGKMQVVRFNTANPPVLSTGSLNSAVTVDTIANLGAYAPRAPSSNVGYIFHEAELVNLGELSVGDSVEVEVTGSRSVASHATAVATVSTTVRSKTLSADLDSVTGTLLQFLDLLISGDGAIGAGDFTVKSIKRGREAGYGHTSAMTKRINVYSFALKPEEHQPSGTCNFSRIDSAILKTGSNLSVGDNIYAVNYNVLRIMSGMGGLAYSN